eukprot:6182490-Pleurochrysis_carterae.AAC.2
MLSFMRGVASTSVRCSVLAHLPPFGVYETPLSCVQRAQVHCLHNDAAAGDARGNGPRGRGYWGARACACSCSTRLLLACAFRQSSSHPCFACAPYSWLLRAFLLTWRGWHAGRKIAF